jgi:hypothetical protein
MSLILLILTIFLIIILIKNEFFMSNCMVVGGGPVALSIACRAYLEAKVADQNAKVNITVFEKRAEYERGFSIKVTKDSLDAFKMKESVTDNEELKEKIRAYNACIPKAGGVIVKEMEEALEKCAKAFQIKINRRSKETKENFEVTKENFDAFLKEQNPSVVLAAAGTKCPVTEKVFGESNREKSSHGAVLQIKFTINNKGTFNKSSKYGIGRFHLPLWFKKLKDGKFSGQSFMILSENETRILNNVYGEKKAREGFTQQDFEESNDHFKQLPTPLKKSIGRIKEGFKNYQENGYTMEDVKIPLVKLDAYKSKKYSTTYVGEDPKNYTVITAGNAAGGVPYQRSFNACLKTVAVASKVLKAHILETDKEKALKEFDKESTKIWNSYYKWTKFYTFFVNVADRIYYLFAKFLDLLTFWKKK